MEASKTNRTRKMKGEVAIKWRAKGVARNFRLIKCALGHVNCFVSIHVLLQLSVFYHHHEEPCQEWFVQVNLNNTQTKNYRYCTPKGAIHSPPPPRISPCLCKWWQNGTRCRDGVKVIVVSFPSSSVGF